MKKLLILLLTLFMLSGCGKKNIPWSDVKDSYDALKNEVNELTSNIDIIFKDDYTSLISELETYINNVQYDMSDENQDILKEIYKVANYINALSSKGKAKYTGELSDLAKNVINLCKLAYDGEEEEFDKLKKTVSEQIASLNKWDDEQWSKVEVLEKYKWKDVEEEFLVLEEEAYDELIDDEDIVETDLEDLKRIIINNYDTLEDGVTSKNIESTKAAYKAAVQLECYARRVYSQEATAVKKFAFASQSFIKECLGKKLVEEELYDDDYIELTNIAKKWTQSIWNQIAARMRIKPTV